MEEKYEKVKAKEGKKNKKTDAHFSGCLGSHLATSISVYEKRF